MGADGIVTFVGIKAAVVLITCNISDALATCTRSDALKIFSRLISTWFSFSLQLESPRRLRNKDVTLDPKTVAFVAAGPVIDTVDVMAIGQPAVFTQSLFET